MSLLLLLKITPDQISLEIPEQAISIHHSNQVAYDSQRMTVLSYGKSENEMKAELGADWPTFLQRTAFTRIFDPKTTGPIFDYQVIELLMMKFRNQAFPKRISNLFRFFKEPLEIKAEIQDYDHLSLGRRRELEYYLQDFERAQRLWINGEDRTISPYWRALQNWAGLLLRMLIPILLLFGGFLILFTRQGQEVNEFLGAALGWIAGAVLAYFLGNGLWLLIFRNHLPHGYLRYQLRSSGSLLRRPTRWLADKILVS